MAGETRKPLDKILCGGKFYRYVVACMHNCPYPHHCKEFWAFFAAKGLTPAEYYNEGGIGEKVMRRVVFDCDRCGKKDIGEMFGLYTDAGEQPENRLTETRRAEMLSQFGYGSQDVNRLCTSVLETLEASKSWQHYCSKCFQRVVDGVATILGEPRKVVKQKEFGFADPNEPLESYDAPEEEGAEAPVFTGDEPALLERFTPPLLKASAVVEVPPEASKVEATPELPPAAVTVAPPEPVAEAPKAPAKEPAKEPSPKAATRGRSTLTVQAVIEEPVPEPMAPAAPVADTAPADAPQAAATTEPTPDGADAEAAEKGRRGRKPKPISLL